ncbi:GNAT family N-acetyltransferase [Ammoniphilus oxalaticus]|uniref:GNAT family N-acetyltransferase n=1 Tax=Ammoniphilus oxalaticus TaxID=66863 RepID=A0A419SKK7_9BACL|nr:GNAT family N-acetyltransferase [Ammoniphilus oxalaticus]RKD24448.1 GNAT family N-acetyltransferase [Ammoniphilus oxalaticus]
MDVNRVTTKQQLEDAFAIRRTVFVEEQGVALEVEFDQHEAEAEHILVYSDERQPIGTGRVRAIKDQAKLERICILAPYRKHGLGKVIIETLEQIAREQGFTKALIHGQTQAEGFYRKLGYVTNSEVFMEDGIPHVALTKQL